MCTAKRALWIVVFLTTALAPVLHAGAGPKRPLQNVTADDLVENGHLIVKGNACIGASCSNSDADLPVLKLKDTFVSILFDTVEEPSSLTSSASRDWALRANPSGLDRFTLLDLDREAETSTTPVVIEGGAPDNALYLDSTGNLGLGSDAPSAPLHVSRSTGGILEGIRLSNDNEARIAIENTNLAVKYFMVVNNSGTGELFFSRDGGGGPIVEINKRNDGGAFPSLKVTGSVQATNVTFSSSRDLKQDFQAVDPQEVLARLAALPISRWRFKEGSPDEHIGPVAEDFHAAFGLGGSEKVISLTDTSGVALAAVQGLLQQVQELRQHNAELSRRLEAMEKLLAPRE